MFETATSPSPASASQKPRWYLARGGERHGPIADAKLFSLAAEDLIAASDLIWRPGFLSWISAGEMPGLLIPPPLPNSLGSRPIASPEPAPRLAVVTETPAPSPAAASPAPPSPDAAEEEPMGDAEPATVQEPAAASVASGTVSWSGNKNLEALSDALRSAPNYAP